MQKLATIFLLMVCLAVASNARAEAGLPKPVDVNILVLLIDLDSIDSVAQRFVANIYFEIRWNDPRLAHAGPDPITANLSDVWNPRVQIINQQNLTRTFPEVVEVAPSGDVVYRQRVWGSFSQPMELSDFPFDSQTMRIQWVAAGFREDAVRLSASARSELSKSVALPDWTVKGWSFKPTTVSLGSRPDEQIQALEMAVEVQREAGFFHIKVIFPLILIVMMSWLVFWIDPQNFAPQISVAITTMLTLIAYRFAIDAMVPKLSFLTRLDYFILGSTILVFLSLVEVIITSRLAVTGKVELARRFDAVGRWLAPVLYALVATESLFFRHLG